MKRNDEKNNEFVKCPICETILKYDDELKMKICEKCDWHENYNGYDLPLSFLEACLEHSPTEAHRRYILKIIELKKEKELCPR